QAGDADAALAHIEKAIGADPELFDAIADDEDFASLRTDPRFAAVLGLPTERVAPAPFTILNAREDRVAEAEALARDWNTALRPWGEVSGGVQWDTRHPLAWAPERGHYSPLFDEIAKHVKGGEHWVYPRVHEQHVAMLTKYAAIWNEALAGKPNPFAVELAI